MLNDSKKRLEEWLIVEWSVNAQIQRWRLQGDMILGEQLKVKVPVDDTILVQEHECWRDLSGIEPRTWLIKLPGTLDLEHQISSVDVLHDEEEPVLRSEKRENSVQC